MRYGSKKFIKFGDSRAVIIPMIWIRELEKQHNRHMTGVHVDIIDGIIQLTPMWEDKNDQ